LQFLIADISFNIACKELKIAQIAQLNQLFQLLHLVRIYGHSFYGSICMLRSKNVNNDVSKDLPIKATTINTAWNYIRGSITNFFAVLHLA